jgi:radical SAM superfamily enzyme YgiQ (UPF0313 family)
MRELRPNLVAISIRNLDDCTAVPSENAPGFNMGTYINAIQKLTQAMREACPDKTFILGGSGFNFCPELLMEKLRIDYGFVGPGELGLPSLITMGKHYGSIEKIPANILEGVPNLIFRRNGLFRRAKSSYKLASESNMNSGQRFPGFAMIERFAKGYVPVRTKTGCSLRCSYCVVPQGEKLSLRPVQNVLKELRELATDTNNVTRIFFADGEFNLPSLNQATEILRKIIQTGLYERLQWVAYFTVKPFSYEFIELMKESNCAGVSLTIDSFSDPILAGVGKNFCQSEAVELLDRLLEANILTYVNLIIGLPGETDQTIEETLALVRTYAQKNVRFFLSAGARVYPNTPLADYVMANQSPHVYGTTNKQFLDPALYCESGSPSLIAKTLLEHVAQLPTVNVMHLNGVHRQANISIQEKKALTRGYYFWGEKDYKEALKWLRKVAKSGVPYRVDALWALALVVNELGNKVWHRRYLSEILKCESQWPDQIDYDGVRQLFQGGEPIRGRLPS